MPSARRRVIRRSSRTAANHCKAISAEAARRWRLPVPACCRPAYVGRVTLDDVGHDRCVDTNPPAHSTSREVAQTVAEAGLNLIPGVGGSVAVILMAALNYSVNQRREQWFTQVAEGIAELRDKVDAFDPQALASDDGFLDSVVTATQIAERNSQQVKRAALRNALLNAALPSAPSQEDQQQLFRLIDELTPTHIRLLGLLGDPPGWFDHTGLARPQFAISSNRTALIKAGMPDLAARGDEMITRYYRALEATGLVQAALGGMMSADGAWNPATSTLGQELLAFIRDPR
ncbi:hypothetical protein [Actinoplanes sp. ATCC 53533]|uniref:hypothetical protein n=1 Tax=Actinoplanes sp. ATCC 53533 TaxID=1288362 RepID=UPI000F786EF9|nr:hypothetical protein [Actinoplanes sp. ATCC 53533]